MFMKWRHGQGFTLVELMVTIALLAFLLLIAYPGFVTMLANLRVRAVADGVLSGLQYARGEALKRNVDVTFRFIPASGVGGGWQVLLPDATVIQQKSAAEGGAVEAMMAGGNVDIVFDNLGRRSQPAAPPAVLNIDITNPAVGACESAGGSIRCLRITVALGGEVRLCDPQRPAGDPQAC
jgi:type IV fimbrial biogenesis protein FimT